MAQITPCFKAFKLKNQLQQSSTILITKEDNYVFNNKISNTDVIYIEKYCMACGPAIPSQWEEGYLLVT